MVLEYSGIQSSSCTGGHTQTAPQGHIASGGNDGDTVKPLSPYFDRMHQVLLVDDDVSKVTSIQPQSHHLSEDLTVPILRTTFEQHAYGS